MVISATEQWLAALDTWQTRKAHPKYSRRMLGLVADGPGTPEEWIGYTDEGKIKGVIISQVVADLVASNQFLLNRVDALEARIEALEAKLR